jgi:hypothetical protein
MAIEDDLKWFPGVVDLDAKRKERASLAGEDEVEAALQFMDLLRFLPDGHLLKRYSKAIAKACWLPESTVFMVGLGVFSSIAMRRYAFSYSDDELCPIGLYVVAEQPSGASKSTCINYFKKPFMEMAAELNRELSAEIEYCSKKLQGSDKKDKQRRSDLIDEIAALSEKRDFRLFLSNVTSEGLEVSLLNTGGQFSCISDEQGLFNTLFGKSYGDGKKKSNNDVVLYGYNGHYFSGFRVGRESYFGQVVGSVVMFCQEGGFGTVFDESKGSGLCERFLAMLEPSFIGDRVFSKDGHKDIASLKAEYSEICHRFRGDISQPVPLKDMVKLKLSEAAWDKIVDYRNQLEPCLKVGGRYASSTLRSMGSKVDMPIIKVAANLHVFCKGIVPDIIEEWEIEQAIGIVNCIYESMSHAMGVTRIDGSNSEEDAILDIFEKSHNRPRSMRDIKNMARRRKEFKHLVGNGCSKQVGELVEKMIKTGFLRTVIQSDGSVLIKK